LLKGSVHGELVGFTSGLLCDLSSSGPFLGVQAFSKVVVGFLTGFMRDRFYSDSLITQSVSGFVATIADKIIALLYLGLLFASLPFPHARLPGVILIAVVNSILVIISFWILKRFIKGEL